MTTIKKKSQRPTYEIIRPGIDESPVIIIDESTHKVLRVTWPSGAQVDVELWERAVGQLEIRSTHGYLVARPHSSNVVFVSTER